RAQAAGRRVAEAREHRLPQRARGGRATSKRLDSIRSREVTRRSPAERREKALVYPLVLDVTRQQRVDLAGERGARRPVVWPELQRDLVDDVVQRDDAGDPWRVVRWRD